MLPVFPIIFSRHASRSRRRSGARVRLLARARHIGLERCLARVCFMSRLRCYRTPKTAAKDGAASATSPVMVVRRHVCRASRSWHSAAPSPTIVLIEGRSGSGAAVAAPLADEPSWTGKGIGGMTSHTLLGRRRVASAVSRNTGACIGATRSSDFRMVVRLRSVLPHRLLG